MSLPITQSPKVRPSVLLWTLLCMSAVGAVFFAAYAWSMQHDVSVLSLREQEMRERVGRERAQIESQTDIQELRRLAVNYRYSVLADWIDYRDRLRIMSEGLFWAAFGLVTVSLALGYSIYGLRIPKQVA